MGKNNIIVLVAVLLALGFRLYKKYSKKDNNISGNGSQPVSGSSFPSSVKDDEYEPYSKK